MKVGIYFNQNYLKANLGNVEKIENRFSAYGVGCIVINEISDLNGIDVLFVLGGDGTILTIAAECAVRGIKIIGVNYGHIGFLAEFEPERLDAAIELILGGKYYVQKRSMLKICCGKNIYYALNDLVVQRSTNGENFANTVNLHAEIDGTTVDNFSSDGIIISTPTGSTAYSLAAGGSVLVPELNAFILTPICAHSLHSRPIVFSDRSTIKINPVNAKTPLVMAIDGKIVGEVGADDKISVTKSERPAEFITSEDTNFFDKLLIKLNIYCQQGNRHTGRAL